MRPLASLAWVAAAAVALVAPPLAAETRYTDRPTFEADVPGPLTVETFAADVADGASISFASGVGSVGTGGLGTPVNTVTGGGWSGKVRNFTTGTDGYQVITWTFPAPTNAVGVDWTSLSSTRGITLTGDWDGTGDESITLFPEIGASDGFFGVIGTVPFTQVTLTATGTGDNDSIGADDLSFDDGTPVELQSFDVD